MAEITSGNVTVIVLDELETIELTRILVRFIDCIDPDSIDVRNAQRLLNDMAGDE